MVRLCDIRAVSVFSDLSVLLYLMIENFTSITLKPDGLIKILSMVRGNRSTLNDSRSSYFSTLHRFN